MRIENFQKRLKYVDFHLAGSDRSDSSENSEIFDIYNSDIGDIIDSNDISDICNSSDSWPGAGSLSATGRKWVPSSFWLWPWLGEAEWDVKGRR